MKLQEFLSPKGSFIDSNVDLTAGTLAWGLRAKEYAKKIDGFINATIGSAKNEEGKLLALKTLKEELANLSNDQLFGYANVRGQEKFVNAWKEDTLSTFPSEYRKKAEELSTLPVTSCGGITGGLTISGQLFLDSKTKLLVPNTRWSNVDNCFFKNQQVKEVSYNLVNEEGELEFQDLILKLKEAEKEKEKIGLYLNFPNNPSGISPRIEEIKVLQEALEEITIPVVIILDDAYEGYVYEKDVLDHSLYPYLIGLNENVLTVKVDGLSKRYSAYGVRIGLVTLGFGSEISEEEKKDYRETIAKAARTLTSSSPRGIQEAFANIYSDQSKFSQLQKEKQAILALLSKRYALLKEEINKRKNDILTPVNFNSGFFGYWIVNDNHSAVDIGLTLLKKGLGTVPFYNKETGLNGIRVAFCSIKTDDIPRTVDILYSS